MEHSRLVWWERHTEWPLAGLAGVFLAAYAVPILDVNLSHGWHRWCDYLVYAAWGCFAVDYVVRVVLATRRWSFVGRHVLDLAAVALPVLRPLRLLRLVALIRVMNRRAASSLHGRVSMYVAASTGLLLFVAALAVLDAERGRAAANIATFGDALWWAITTMTTVGYGDRYPVTTEGRFVAVGLMVAGVALIGVVTATIASWLIAQVRDAEQDTAARLSAQVEQLSIDVAALRTARPAADHHD